VRSFVTAIKKSHVDTPGNRRDYQSVYLRRAYRDSGTVRNETVANQSMPPQAAIAAIEATLKDTRWCRRVEFTIARVL